MALGTIGPDRLALALLHFQPADQHRVDQGGDQERRHHRRARAEGQVLEQAEEGELVGMGEKREVIKHQAPFSLRASMMTDILAPLDSLTRTASPGLCAARTWGSRLSEVSP